MKKVSKFLTCVSVLFMLVFTVNAQNHSQPENPYLYQWDELQTEYALVATDNQDAHSSNRQGGCNNITGLKTDIISLQTVTLRWDKNPQVQKYVLRGRKIPGGQLITVDVPAGQDSLIINGMEPNREYAWQVLAVCDTTVNFTSQWSAIDTFRPICIAPEGLFSSNITSSTVKLNWDPIPGSAQYRVRGRPLGSPFWAHYVTSAINNFYNIIGLQPGTTYQWSVRTHCDAFANRVSVYAGNQVFTTTTFNRLGNPEAEEFQLYPNPSKGNFEVNLELMTEGAFVLRVISMVGKELYHETGEVRSGDNRLFINLKNAPPGVYFTELEVNNQTFRQKVVIE